jgi:AcrR family transcriptional regulator
MTDTRNRKSERLSGKNNRPTAAPNGNRRIPQQRRSHEKVQRILNSAAELLEEVPWDDVTSKLIRERASVTAPTFYAYFEDRDAVLRTLGLQFISEGREVIENIVNGGHFESWDSAAAAVIDTYVAWFRERVGLRALWFSGHLDDQVHQADRDGNNVLASIYKDLLEKSGGQAGVPDHVYRFCIEMIDKGIALGFAQSVDGDDQVFSDLTIATNAYLRIYLD